MFNKRGLLILLIFTLLVSFVGAQRFFDPGYGSGFGGGGFGFGSGGTGFISGLCDSYGDWVEFFILFIIFFILAHWAFKSRPKGDLLSGVVGLALAFAIVRWESISGFSFVCGLGGSGGSFGGLFGGFVGIALLLIIIFGFFALAKGGSGSKALAGLAYLLFYFWIGSEGGYYFSDLFYYLPLDPSFVSGIFSILLFVSLGFVIIFGYRWFKESHTK